MKANLNRMFTALMLLALVLTFVAVPVSAAPSIISLSVTAIPPTAGSAVEFVVEFTPGSTVGPGEFVYLDIDEEVDYALAPNDPPTTAFEWTSAELDSLNPADVVYSTPTGYHRFGLQVPTGESIGDMDPVVITATLAVQLTNPPLPGDYDFRINAENNSPRETTFTINPGAVRLFLKRQVPHHLCGYKQLDEVSSYKTIKEALDAARSIWMQDADQPPEKDMPRWNLFDDCPDLYCQDVPTEAVGIYVGAVIAVGPGTYTDTLNIDVPGLIIGSTDGPDTTIIDVEGEVPLTGTNVEEAGVFVRTGGVSIGRATIYEGADDFGDPTLPFELYGFTIQNTGVGVDLLTEEGYGVGVEPVDSYPVFHSIPAFQGLNTGEFTGTASEELVTQLDLTAGQKLVNVSTGVSGYIVGDGPGSVTVEKTLGSGDLFSPTDEFIKDGDYYAVFSPTDAPAFTCDDARVDIRGNTIQDNESGGIGVYNASVWVDDNIVQDNDDDGFWGEELRCDGVLVCDGDEREKELLQISNNEFLNNGTGSPADYQGGSGCFDEDVDPNDDDYNQAGIHIVSTAGSDGGYLYINNNLAQGNAHAGIWLDADAAAGQYLRIFWNDLLSNGFGLATMAGATTEEVDFRYNDIVGNSLWGVKNFEAGVWFTAKENYWGSWAGPSDGPRPCAHQVSEQSEALGNGDAVSSYVYYNPWLTVDADDLKLGRPYQHVRAYGSDTLTLQMGWNTLSLPLPPDARANSLEEIFNLGPGTFLQDEDGNPKFEKAYEYTGAWDSLTTGGDDDDLKVLHGYYIKMLEPTRFPVIYGTTWIELPEYELAQGWNLIGAGFGIDRVATGDEQGRWAVAEPNDDMEAEKYESEALVSIAPDTVGGGVAMVVSPYVAGQINSWVDTWPAGAGTPSTNNLMYTGEGYWAFMKQAGTLAGFESAPLSFQGDPPLPMR